MVLSFVPFLARAGGGIGGGGHSSSSGGGSSHSFVGGGGGTHTFVGGGTSGTGGSTGGGLEVLLILVPIAVFEAWERQRDEIERYRSSGRRNVLDNLTVAKATIVAAASDNGHDVVTVRFRAASANYDVDLASGKVVRGNHEMAFWEQDWVFQRSSHATTDAGGGAGERCPHCGAPLNLDLAGVCRNCRAPVRSGDKAWVVVRAEQAQHVPS